MTNFFFYTIGRRRNRTEIMHDILMTAQDGILRTRLMGGANLSWAMMHELLKVAQDAGFIEEVDIQPPHWRKKPTRGWKTTKKGLECAQAIHENYKLLQETES
ncbi:unnamed protein product [marine sediment metagenome]|uniref:ArnR1-like winged helix-turn-helix domain-containing protein n=1 Tax=marine sediment metagenome TaxID=412755 RepID=X1J1J6_9ZZZZ